MLIVKLNAIDSTNSYLRKLSAEETVDDYTTVIAKKQTQGRGQMGTVWSSQASKNLTFSVFKDVSQLHLEHPFYISIITSLALLKTLQFFSISRLSVKWPNDILSEDKKICGILIENVIKQNKINASVIGIGLNVNQTKFENLPKASSLKMISGKIFDLDEIVHVILKNLKYYFLLLKKGQYDVLKEDYEAYLFRKNKPSTFKDKEGTVFSGFIEGISESGNLQVLLEDDIIKEFDLKAITLLY
ncbi:biotin--[acetyl-CoA-carboxylase] ligase [Flavivirga spongiicola]|uniref:Biotin--[acetyl-CoA-carboxylase] ligase n=1 Tax=Flavivirga spongiicola TaxID=421621 RepID=A0ABU7XQR8_9FLAO|nr:biotin--[acetyl-CoA-carboxylase] ligase [Flavivirga sp. MEBiC05379]MDO5977925.1 biotin--[acetyl-CoA-carboxylase] ligase [Flavivirga sp. MEBiC05379]